MKRVTYSVDCTPNQIDFLCINKNQRCKTVKCSVHTMEEAIILKAASAEERVVRMEALLTRHRLGIRPAQTNNKTKGKKRNQDTITTGNVRTQFDPCGQPPPLPPPPIFFLVSGGLKRIGLAGIVVSEVSTVVDA